MAEEVIGLLFGVDGGGSIDGKSGKLIVDDITKIVNQINAGKSKIPKVKLRFDVSEAKKAIADLKKEIKKLEKTGKIRVTHTTKKSSGGTKRGDTSSDDTKAAAENYRKLTASVKEYHAALTEIERIQMKSTAVSQAGDGTWESSDSQYAKRIARVNELKSAYDKLGASYTDDGELQIKTAKELGITEEQRIAILSQIQSAETQLRISNERNSASTQAAWSKNAAKVHEYILRIRDIASKNPDVKQMMLDLDRLATTGDKSNLDQLTTDFAELQRKIRETGADIETWGQKMAKTFGTRVRSLLAGIVVGKVTQYLREVYTNVVKLDKALVNLQIATGGNREQAKALLKEYSALAKQLGATTEQVAEAADTWLRQGYTAEEANVLIRNSMMLSTLGQMESAEAATALTSAMKGYGVSVQDATSIVDKFTKVDMEAAASAGDIATAMSETAASARIAGVSMDTLIGYITTVKEVTQDSSESVGTFLKTLFARMNNVAAGNFVDEETGEALNDVETVLNKLGIALRDSNGQFRASSEVLDEVASRWENFDTVQQHAIATAFAGTRQQEKFLVLMQNYGTAMQYATTATQSAGTATEKFEAHTSGLEGKINALTATFEEFSMSILDSDLVGVFFEIITGLISGLDTIVSLGDGFIVKAALVVAAVLGITYVVDTLQKKLGVTIKSWGDFVAAIQMGATSIGGALKSLVSNPYLYLVTLVTLFASFSDKMPAWSLIVVGAILAIGTAVTVACAHANAAVWGFMASNPIGWILLAITAVVVAITSVIKALVSFSNSTTQAKEEAVDAAKKAKEELQEVEKEIDAVNDKIEESKERLAELQKLSNSGTITLAEQHEMDKLSSTISKLEAEKQLLEDIATLKRQEAQSGAVNAMRAIRGEKLSDAYIQEDNTFWNGVGRSLASVLSFGLSDALGGYGISDWSVKTTTSDQYVDDILGNWESATEQQRGYVIDFYNQLAEQKEMLTYYSGENLTQWQKDCNDAYNSYYEFTHKLLIAQGNFETAWNSIITMERFSGLQDTLVGVADSGTLTPANLKTIANSNAQLSEFIDYLSSIGYFSWYDQQQIDGLVYQINSMATAFNQTVRPAKSFVEILNEVQGSYDILSDAINDMDEYGAVSAKTLSTLLEEYPQLEKYLTMTANGYTISADALDEYVHSLRDAYVQAVVLAEEGSEAYENAYTELERFLAVIATMELSDAIEKETESLEAEQDALEDQLDKYKELIDMRKDLLETYAEELAYQKELEKKQRNIARLRTRLAVARLDNSASGQARVRELETELEEAQEELDDFTLEHAIDTLTQHLDKQYRQHEGLIKSQISDITRAIEDVRSTISETAKTSDEQIQELITKFKQDNPDVVSNSGGTQPQPTPPPAPVERTVASQIVKLDGASGSGMNAGKTGDNGIVTWNGKEYKVENKGSQSMTSALGQAVTELGFEDRQIFWYKNILYGYLDGHIQQLGGRRVNPQGYFDLYGDVLSKYNIYHSGGIVGGVPTVSAGEEFAKLLKGEFVSTPSQMKRFMEETLPQIANYASSGANNEFNAPLIEITCESVTTESMPELKRIVNEAVKEIQKQLDSGMSRTGFKRPVTKSLV